MDVKAITNYADPVRLNQEIQSNIDSVAGQHVDMTSIEILLNAIHGINPIPILINLFIILMIAALTYWMAGMADRILKVHIPRIIGKGGIEMDETISVMIRRLATASIYILGIMLIVQQIPPLQSLTAVMLASAGIAGLAIGYAAKDSLANFTSGIFLAIFQPFRVGDWIDFRNDYGRVEDLTLRHTVILTKDYRRIIVPNNIMSNEPIINWTIRSPEITWTVDFDLSRASDIDRARNIILEEAKSHPKVLKDREIKVLMTYSKYSELNLRLYMDIPGRDVANDIGCEIREAIKKRFEMEGILPATNEN